MKKVGGGGLVVAGLFMIFLGWVIQSNILEWLLNILGFVVIVGGVIAGVVGLIMMLSGRKSPSSDF